MRRKGLNDNKVANIPSSCKEMEESKGLSYGVTNLQKTANKKEVRETACVDGFAYRRSVDGEEEVIIIILVRGFRL